MDVTVDIPRGFDHAVVVESVDAEARSIRNFRGRRLTHEDRVVAAGALIVLHAAGSRYWPGVTELYQVSATGALIPLTDESGVIRAAGSGRTHALGPRVDRALWRLRAAEPDDAERAAIDSLRAVSPERRELIMALARGDGFCGDAPPPALDPMQAP